MRNTWKNGHFAGMDSLFPQAFAELEYHFNYLGSESLMSRCMRQRTTNMNESLHQKLALILHKCKSHTTDRVNFGANSVLMSHNFGHNRGSLLNISYTLQAEGLQRAL